MGALRALGQGCTRSPFGEGRRLSREAPIPSVQGKGKSGSPETGTSAPLPPETAVGRRGAPPPRLRMLLGAALGQSAEVSWWSHLFPAGCPARLSAAPGGSAGLGRCSPG